MALEIEKRLKMNDGDKLVQKSHRSKGTLAETDIWEYIVVDKNDNEVGAVRHTDHTSIKGFNRSQSLEQWVKGGPCVVDVTWAG